MMKITFCKNSESTMLKLEGKLAGPWVNELEKAWRAFSPTATPEHLVVNLSDVTFVDDDGRKLLAEMHKAGAELIGDGLMTRFTIERIKQGRNGDKSKGHEGNGHESKGQQKSGGKP